MKQSAFDDFSEAAQEALDFARCQRPDGTYYGTSGQCRKGTLTDPKEKTAPKAKSKKAQKQVKTLTEAEEDIEKFTGINYGREASRPIYELATAYANNEEPGDTSHFQGVDKWIKELMDEGMDAEDVSDYLPGRLTSDDAYSIVTNGRNYEKDKAKLRSTFAKAMRRNDYDDDEIEEVLYDLNMD